MRMRLAAALLSTLVVVGSPALRAMAGRDPGVCPRSSNLIGQVSVFGDKDEASWWHLIYYGMIAGNLLTPDQQRDYLNGVFGTTFTTLEDVRLYNLQSVSDGFDKNQNGYVCAYDLQGTRAYNNDPYFKYTWFSVSDDKIRK